MILTGSNAQKKGLLEELLDEFVPMASGQVETGSLNHYVSPSATGHTPFSAETQAVESTLRVSLRAAFPVERHPGGVKDRSESDLEDTAESEAQSDDM